MNQKEFEKLQQKVTRLVKRRENTGRELSDTEIAIIQNIASANSYKDINILALEQIQRMLIRL